MPCQLSCPVSLPRELNLPAHKTEEPNLYGLKHSNRTGKDLWGKNQFNSTFPVALCCYMRDKGIKPVYIAVNEDFTVRTTDEELFISDIYGAQGDVWFGFETPFSLFDDYVTDQLESIDLVTKTLSGNFLKPLEIKLTVLPDNSTFKDPESKWSCELVIRPITSAYATLLFADRVLKAGFNARVLEIISPVARKIQDWNNKVEIGSLRKDIIEALRKALVVCHELQTPFLIQPVWKTRGKFPELKNQCFDVFVWSNLAVCKMFIDRALTNINPEKPISRSVRECARTLRCLYNILTEGAMNYDAIYRGMALGKQTDKADAYSGKATFPYMKHPRLANPIINRNALRDIIQGGGEKLLSPERRFDATVYFTCRTLFES